MDLLVSEITTPSTPLLFAAATSTIGMSSTSSSSSICSSEASEDSPAISFRFELQDVNVKSRGKTESLEDQFEVLIFDNHFKDSKQTQISLFRHLPAAVTTLNKMIYLGGGAFHFEVYNNRRNQAAILETKNKTSKE
ncbi:hypothetical protein NC652_000370 [Populus alba x Populus x berolinensis]|nr:hypothetical protein NC652_000370 [Populus alba x Populus x berolinensis]